MILKSLHTSLNLYGEQQIRKKKHLATFSGQVISDSSSSVCYPRTLSPAETVHSSLIVVDISKFRAAV